MNQQEKTGLFHAYHNAEAEFMDIDNEIKVSKLLGSLAKGNVQNAAFVETNYLGKIISHSIVPVSACTLLLTPLDRITDAHAIEVCRLGKYHFPSVAVGKDLLDNYLDKQTNVYACDWINIFDFLRSHSYNIGYLHYSPSQLVELGVVKYE